MMWTWRKQSKIIREYHKIKRLLIIVPVSSVLLAKNQYTRASLSTKIKARISSRKLLTRLAGYSMDVPRSLKLVEFPRTPKITSTIFRNLCLWTGEGSIVGINYSARTIES